MPIGQANIDRSSAGKNSMVFMLEKYPDFKLMINAFTFPGISTDPIELYGGQWTRVAAASHKAKLEDFSVVFIVREDFSNYFFVYDWIRRNVYTDEIRLTKTDANVMIFDNHKNPLRLVNFQDVHPMSLSSLETSVTEPDTLTATLVLKCEDYNVREPSVIDSKEALDYMNSVNL